MGLYSIIQGAGRSVTEDRESPVSSTLGLEEQGAIRGQHNRDGMISSMIAMRLSGYSSEVALSTSSIFGCVAVEDLFPVSTRRDANSVILSRHRCKIADNYDRMVWASPPT